MPISFNTNGSASFTKPPRIVRTVDTGTGCPTSRGNPLMSITFTTTSVAAIIIEGEIIRRRDGNGRCDLGLRGPGYPNISQDSYLDANALLDYTLDYNDGVNSEWDNACFRWMGYAPAGTLTFYCNSESGGACNNLWGCSNDGNWGQLSAIIFE